MAKTVRDTRLESRTARSRLPEQHKPHWRALDQGLHLGYRRGHRGGTWRARMFADGRYREEKLGLADDIQDADGLVVLSYSEAQAKAREWFNQQQRLASGVRSVARRRYTVADVMQEYLGWYKAHRKGLASTRAVVEAHILPALGAIEVRKLTTDHIRSFHEKLASCPARLRSKEGAERPAYRDLPEDPEAKEAALRARKATANRILTVLKAALNAAYKAEKIGSADVWQRVDHFRNVDEARVRFLLVDECPRLVKACSVEFRPLVQGALLTGCRYGELIHLQVRDFDRRAGTIHVTTSKAGKARHVVLTQEGIDFFTALVADRIGAALIFTRANGSAWGKSHQFRPLEAACKAAKITPTISFHILRHSYASQLAINGTPLKVIATQLGHSDTRMVEKHYAHLAQSYIADTVRSNFPRLGIAD